MAWHGQLCWFCWPALLWVLRVGSCYSESLQAMRGGVFSVLSLNTKKSVIHTVIDVFMFYAGYSLRKWTPNNTFQ